MAARCAGRPDWSPKKEVKFESVQEGECYESNLTELGRGGYGKVVLAKRTRDQRAIAIKIPNSHHSKHEEECDIMERLKKAGGHNNVTKMLDIVVDVKRAPRITCIVLEKFDMNLEEWIELRGLGTRLPEYVKLEMAAQMYDGLSYIHANDVVYEDVKFDNMLIDLTTGLLKLADFGHSSILPPANDQATIHQNRIALALDLRDMTSRVVTPLWLGREYTEPECHDEALSAMTLHPQLVEALQVVFSDTADEGEGAMRIKLQGDIHWWESMAEMNPDLRKEILLAHRWNVQQPNPCNNGIALPDNVSQVLSIALLYARLNKATASHVRESILEIPDIPNMKLAREYLRQRPSKSPDASPDK
eukprot:scpid85968/ scgid12430/ Probable serine/threonine-protein kinase MARK-B